MMSPERSDLRRTAYIATVLDMLEGDGRPSVLLKARRTIELWRQVPGMHPVHADRWSALLDSSPEAIRAAVLADTPEARELRHCMPFAGVLSNAEQRALGNKTMAVHVGKD